MSTYVYLSVLADMCFYVITIKMYATRSRKGFIFIMFARILKTTFVKFKVRYCRFNHNITDANIYCFLMTPSRKIWALKLRL